MSYENAPATAMIAVNCACCGRPLLDAKSVETGMGPHCRAKHGFNAADFECDFIAVAATLAATLGDEAYATLIAGVSSAREAANKLVHWIACKGLCVETGPMIEALAELGFTKLAGIMRDRAAPVRIVRTETTVEIEAPFSDEFTAIVRTIPSRRWVKHVGRKGGKNVFSTTVAGVDARVFGALRKAYPGMVANGPKGLFTIPGVAA